MITQHLKYKDLYEENGGIKNLKISTKISTSLLSFIFLFLVSPLDDSLCLDEGKAMELKTA